MTNFSECAVTSRDGTRIAYLVAGSGRPLVIVHGGFTVADEWLTTAESLVSSRRVMVVERRGRGRSGDAEAHSMETELDDLAAVMAEAGPDADLFGHSFGGALSIAYALRSGFAGKLVVYEPPASFGGLVGGNALPPIAELLTGGKSDEALVLAHRSLTRTPEHEIEAFRNTPLWTAHRNLLAQLLREVAALDRFSPDAEDCKALTCRTVLLVGSETQQFVRDIAGGWLARMPGLTVLPIRGQSHICHLVDPRLMAECIEAALGV